MNALKLLSLLGFAALVASCDFGNPTGGGTGGEGLTGIIVDPQGSPVAGAVVRLYPESATTAGPGIDTNVTDALGKYAFKKIKRGRYNVASYISRGEETLALFIRDINLKTAIDGRVDTLREAGEIHITVKGSTNMPAQGVACGIAASPWYGVSDSAGHCVLLAVAPGSHAVIVSAPGMSPVTEILTVDDGETKDIEVSTNVVPPSISYASQFWDTTNQFASHAVTSNGGPVTHYSWKIDESSSITWGTLTHPPGYTLDTATGLISGTPRWLVLFNDWGMYQGEGTGAGTYHVIASGPGGSDTVAVHFNIFVSSGQEPVTGVALTVIAEDVDTAASRLNPWAQMIVTLTSSANEDSVIRDTIPVASFEQANVSGRLLSKFYLLKPLRNWTVTVDIRDAHGNTVSTGTKTGVVLMLGEIQSVSVITNNHQIEAPVIPMVAFPD